ncbi:MAG: site-2 protease family protein [Planctomycetes bacterium]|jgi:regulator of sigma E protease|nr:site-2 protease family protein [Planctomycetota bacterium]MCL4730662.1 site-2 protease family protein [Planctomycetota bacterium]
MTILYILQVLIGFGFVIFIHEMGHFLAAKRVGITCPAFSIGFPFPVWTPKGWKAFNIFRYKWRGTEYRLGWIPFGGYVQMRGQSDNPGQMEGPKPDDSSDYRNKTYWQKTQVLLGGVTMNAITALIFFVLAFSLGVTFIEPTVGMIDSRSQAWVDNEIRVGDRVLEVNGREVVDFEDVVYAGIFDGGDSVRLKIRREVDGQPVIKDVTLSLDEDPVFGLKLPAIKAKHRTNLLEDEIARFPESLGEDRPREGDELVAVNGRRVLNFHDAVGLVAASRGEVELTLRRGLDADAREWKVRYTPRRKFYSDTSAFIADVSFMPPVYADRVQRGSAADRAGLKQGDRIVGVHEGDRTRRFDSFGDLTLTMDNSGGRPLRLLVERDGREITLDVTPDPRESSPGRYSLGINVTPFDPRGKDEKTLRAETEKFTSRVVAWGIRPGSPLRAQGMQPGDEIVGMKINGKDTPQPNGRFDRDAVQAGLLQAAMLGGAEIAFAVNTSSGTREFTVKVDENGPDSAGFIALATAEQRSQPVTYGIGESITQGFYHSKKVGYKILMTLAALFTGRVKLTHMAGPVVIAKRSYALAQWGVGTLVFFLAFISINLAIVNLIPLPVLDGGQWLVVTIEAIRGKPLPERAMTWVSTISFFAVVGLMLFVLGNDLVTVFWRKWV